MTLIGDVFPKLRTPKKVIRWMSEKSHFRGRFDKQLGKQAQTVLQSGRRHLYHICWSLWKQLSWKKSLFVLCKILRLFVNTLTADDKHFLLSGDKLTRPIQILLSEKQDFFWIFLCVSQIYFKFWVFLKKRWPSYAM